MLHVIHLLIVATYITLPVATLVIASLRWARRGNRLPVVQFWLTACGLCS